MKKKYFITVLLFFWVGVQCWSQVGINTTDPQATLDINGNLRVRVTQKCLTPSCADSILVQNAQGYVQTISKAQLAAPVSGNKSFVSGTGNNNIIPVAISSANNWGKILFDKELIDENSDFDMVNNIFTAPLDGIYEVYVQYKVSSAISAGDLGIGIFVQKGILPPELVAEESYTNLSLLGVPVSPATRRTQIVVALKSGDQVFFGAKASVPTLDLLSGASSLFTIHQIK
ncbi:hypothetical protein [Chryseobacterium sp. Alg-005]|uniref:hypothetical protein n=1 Tax=Chryseobacterium sp. Alg-005 TaxID=3159516 RepID=UPI0036F24EC1